MEITPGAVFHTHHERGCVAQDAPDETGEFLAFDSDNVTAWFNVVQVESVGTLLDLPVISMPWPPEYGDLFPVIGHDVEMAGYCDRNYTAWEQNVAEPELNDRGFNVIEWRMGERDSFGPLSRIAVVEKDGVRRKLVYG